MQERILHFLKKHDGYISGEEMSHALSLSRAAVWKHIQELRKEGYDIVAVPHLGYKLIAAPDKLFAHEIQSGLGTKTFGREIVHYDSVSSTMDAAFALGVQGAAEGTVVCAEQQTKGRGRLQRAWASPQGKGVYLSVLARPRIPPSEAARLTLMCAVAVSEAVAEVSALSAAIKWPNDLLINGKKVAGILTELSAETDRIKFIVIGIGVNVNAKKSALPAGATSLSHEAQRPVSRIELAQALLRSMERWYYAVQADGFSAVAERWRALSITLHRHVRVSDAHGVVEGEAVDIDDDGGLLIRIGTGVIVKKMAGDVALVR